MAQDVGLPVGTRQRMTRLSLGTLVARKVDRLIVHVQGWLETNNQAVQKFVAYTFIFLFLTYLASAVIRFWG